MNIPFHKYHGTGNDFIVGDNRTGLWNALNDEQRMHLCHRRFGIGADGILLLAPPPESNPHLSFSMQYFNADGRPGTFCGNGSRCLLSYAGDVLGLPKDQYIPFMASDGIHQGKINQDKSVSVLMKPSGEIKEHQEGFLLDTGSPHLVIFNQQVAELNVFELGRRLRHLPEFEPDGVNVNFYRVEDDGSLFVRTYERGVEDETYSCGTGVTAVALVHLKNLGIRTGSVSLKTPGGILKVDVESGSGGMSGPTLNGPAACVFTGTFHCKQI